MNEHLSKFARRQDLYKFMFSWIKSKQDSFKSASVAECMRTFYTRFKIDKSKFPLDTAYNVFEQMNKEFIVEEELWKEQFGITKENG